MYLDGARLPARLDPSGNLNTLFDQDRSCWDRAMIGQGRAWLERSATGSALSRYHVEAAIADVHAMAPRFDATDWKTIVSLYDTLMTIAPSPIVALNRAIAIAQLAGPQSGLDAIDAIVERHRLTEYPFYHATLGELELRRNNLDVAREHFQAAVALARNPVERRFYQSRLSACTRQRATLPA
jgi:RNA polymerase sigma-70 factor (ECF subfamily)